MYHDAFCLDPQERGETDLLTIGIVMGEAAPKKQAASWVPFAVRLEGSQVGVCQDNERMRKWIISDSLLYLKQFVCNVEVCLC